MIENRGFKSVCCAVHDVDRNFTCLWMRPRNLPHVSSSLMLPTDDSLARYLTHHHRTTGDLYHVIRQNICTETWARLRHGEILKRRNSDKESLSLWTENRLPIALWECCGKKSGHEDTERRGSGLSCMPPPGQTGQGERTAHTHVDVWEHGISLGALPFTHAPRVTSASYLQFQLHFTEIGFLHSFEWACRIVRPGCSVREQRVESKSHRWRLVKEDKALKNNIELNTFMTRNNVLF